MLAVVADRNDLAAVSGGADAVGIRAFIACRGGDDKAHIPQFIDLLDKVRRFVEPLAVRCAHGNVDNIDTEPAAVLHDPVDAGYNMRDHAFPIFVEDLYRYNAGFRRHAAKCPPAERPVSGRNTGDMRAMSVVIVRGAPAVDGIVPARDTCSKIRVGTDSAV